MIVCFTFDDGFLDGLVWYMAFKEKASFFVCPGLIGNAHPPNDTLFVSPKESRMNWGQLKYLKEEGCEIACHGWLHEDWSEIDENSARSFLDACDGEFARWLGPRPVSFSYPFGQENHSKVVLERYKQIRPIPRNLVPIQYDCEGGPLLLFLWSRLIERWDENVIDVTEGLIAQKATFVTFQEACEKGWIKEKS